MPWRYRRQRYGRCPRAAPSGFYGILPHHRHHPSAGGTGEEVETITLSRPGVTALGGPVHPANLIDMAHSPAYCLAAGVADRDFSWAHATTPKITDPVIHQLIDKVRVGAPPTAHVEQYRQGATVTIRTTDGRSFSNTVFAPKGSGVLGIAWADIDAKYRALAPQAPLSAQQVEASLEVIHNFRHITRVAVLIDLLRVGSRHATDRQRA